MNAVIPLAHLRHVLAVRRLQLASRFCAFSTHPYTGADCRNPGRWRAHGGPLISPWCAGFTDQLIERAKSRGRKEVLRTWGVGIRQLQAEQRGAK